MAVEFHDDFEPEFLAFEPATQDALVAVAKLIADYGPQLGRPYADTLKGSNYVNMKELWFEVSDGEWRTAFAFAPQRLAILLVAGDKSGGSKKRFLPAAYRKGGQAVFGAPESPERRKEGEVRCAVL